MRKLMLVGAMLAMMLTVAAPAMAQEGGDAFTVNEQNCIAVFGDQNANIDQYGDDNEANLTQQQVFECNQIIQNITEGGSVQYGDDDDNGGAYVPGDDQYAGDDDDNGAVVAPEGDSGVAGDEGFASLPDTGGASALLLGAGALLVGGGLLARRIAR